jgi:hypothetical protein
VFLGLLAVQPDPDKCNTVEVHELFIGSSAEHSSLKLNIKHILNITTFEFE